LVKKIPGKIICYGSVHGAAQSSGGPLGAGVRDNAQIRLKRLVLFTTMQDKGTSALALLAHLLSQGGWHRGARSSSFPVAYPDRMDGRR
jgi:hypothetical protein